MEYQCDVCAKIYQNKTSLKKHQLYHVEDNVSCNICSKSFKNKKFLKIHSVVHGEKEYKCEHCQKIFYQRQHLSRHKKIHAKKDAKIVLESLSEFEALPRFHITDTTETDKTPYIENTNIDKTPYLEDYRNYKSEKLPISLHWLVNAEKSQSLQANMVLVEQILNAIVDSGIFSQKGVDFALF